MTRLTKLKLPLSAPPAKSHRAADAPAGTEAYRAPVAHQLQHHPLRQLHRGPGPGLAGFARDWGAVVKAGLATLLLATVLTGAGALAAPKPDSDQTVLATKAAMDAFFSMEGSTPEGVSNSSAPDGFQGGGEAELIAYLSEQRGHGARWDRYRYLGTLLHHSLRAGFDDVARWLLRNGADPTQRIDAGGLDALGVAVRMERWSLVRPLLRHPAYQRLAKDEVAERLWAGAIAPEQRAALLRLRPAVPVPALGKAGSPLLAAALCSADLTIASGLLAQVSTPIALEPKPRCAGFEAPAPHRMDFKAWHALEAKFTQALLPYIVPSMRSAADLRAALASGLAQPWQDAGFVAAFVDRVPHRLLPDLLLSQSAWGVPTRVLWPKVSVHQAVELWKLPTARFESLVRSAPVESLFRLAEAGIWGAGHLGPSAPKHWELIVAQLAALPTADRLGFKNADHLLREVPSTQFELVLAWAVAADRVPESIAPWYFHASASAMERAWPTLKKHAPRWANELLAGQLATVSADPPTDRLGKALLPFSVGVDAVAKAKFLRVQGLTAKPRLLASGEARGAQGDEARCCAAPLARWAVTEGLLLLPKEVPTVALAPQSPTSQSMPANAPVERLALTAAPPECKPVASTGLRAALAAWMLDEAASTDEPRRDASQVQPLAAPGQPNCQWLHSWTEVHGGGWTDRSFFDGEHYESHRGSVEETLYVRRWDEPNGRWLPLRDIFSATGLVEVELLPHGDRFWLALDSHANGDHPASAFLVQWQQAEPKFEGLPQTSALDARWQSVVDPREASTALGLLPADGTPSPDRQRLPREPVPALEFADSHWTADRQAFLNAFMALERRALSDQQQVGLFPHWLDAAVLWLSANTDLSLAQRRARMAWLLANPKRAAALSDEAVESLVPWLPAEDWVPILETRRCPFQNEGRSLLRGLVSNAPANLGRRLTVALAKACQGEVQ
jgi:hypothetical protein